MLPICAYQPKVCQSILSVGRSYVINRYSPAAASPLPTRNLSLLVFHSKMVESQSLGFPMHQVQEVGEPARCEVAEYWKEVL
jgi:hypothetical protein